MQVPLQITMRTAPHSIAVEKRIRAKAEKLNHFSAHIIACHIVVEQLAGHQSQGQRYNVRINLSVPGKELVVNHNQQENLYLAIREAFDDMVRQLEEATRVMNGTVKSHPDRLRGRVARLFASEDFGFIVTANGDEYYFNAANVVHPRFAKLAVGTTVQFIPKMGDEGLRAHRVSAKECRA